MKLTREAIQRMISQKQGATSTTIIEQGGGGGSQPSITLGPLLTSLNAEAMPVSEGYLHWSGTAWEWTTPTGGDPVDLTPYAQKTWVQNNYATLNDISGLLTKSEADGYYAPISFVKPYLPLAAGSSYPLTGSLYINGNNNGIQWSGNKGMLCYKPASGWSGVTSTQWGVGSHDANGIIRSGSALERFDGTNNYTIYDSSNLDPLAYLRKDGGTVAGTLNVKTLLNVQSSAGANKVTIDGSTANIDIASGGQITFDTDSHIAHDATNDRLVIHGNNGLLIDSDTYVGSVAITNLVATQGYVGSSINTAIDNYAATVASTYATKTQLADYLPLAGGTVTGICSFENDVDVSGRLSLNTDSYFEVGDDDILYIYGDAGVYFYNRPFVGSLAASAQVALLSDLATYATLTQLNTACDNLMTNVAATYATKAQLGGYLPLTAGSSNALTGNIAYKGTKATYEMITFIDNTADAFGNGIAIGGGGAAIIGGGESASVMRGQLSSGGNEVMCIGNDQGVNIYTNLQNGWSYRKEFSFDTNGDFSLLSGVNGRKTRISACGGIYLTAGTSYWANGMYAMSQADASLGEVGFFGNGETLTYMYIGAAYNNTWMVVKPDGKVGIGTTQPDRKLHVNGDFGVGNVYAGSYLFMNANNAGIYMNSTGIAWHNSSNLRTADLITFTSGGNVGIGTTQPDRKLHVNGDFGVGNVYAGSYLFMNANNAGIYMNSTGIAWHNSSNQRTADLITFTSGGNVGIGTSSPSYNLDVNGIVRAATGLMVRNGTSDAIGFDTTAMFFNKAQTGGSPITSTVATFTWDNTNQRIVVGFSTTPKVGTTEVALKSDISFASRQNNVLTLTTDFLVAAAGIECDDIIYASSDLKTGDSLYFGASASDDDGYGRLYADNSGNLWFQPTNGTAKRIAFV